MPFKDPKRKAEYNREYGRQWYQRNREKHMRTTAVGKSRAKDRWFAFKATMSCMVCGENHVAALDFHHVEASDKKVHRLVSDGAYAAAMKEVEKCLVLCANCHRKHHWEEDRKRMEEAESTRAAKVLTKLGK